MLGVSLHRFRSPIIGCKSWLLAVNGLIGAIQGASS